MSLPTHRLFPIVTGLVMSLWLAACSGESRTDAEMAGESGHAEEVGEHAEGEEGGEHGGEGHDEEGGEHD